jgi:hypothetical protein
MRAWVTSERYHDSIGSRYGGMRALPAMEERERETLSVGDGGAEETRLRLGIPKREGKTSIYKGRWNERRTVRLDPCVYRISSSCLIGSHAHATPSRSLDGRIGWWFALPNGPRTATGKKAYGAKNTPTAH